MKKFIGTKTIEAEPMTRGDYNKYRGWTIPADENPYDEGYLVKYSDGYISWSPKKQFEEAYRISGEMSFGHALEMLKRGKKVARKGWNGKGMCLFLISGEHWDFDASASEWGAIKSDFIAMNTADGHVDPWLASQTDMLAEDWEGSKMVKTYKYNDTTQLSPHFNVQEFRCKCGQAHDILINTDLVDKLEQLFTALDCSAIIINSGHRCASHDKAVGGLGTGQHVNGNAVDIVCYDKSHNKISSKIVCCKAQDVGFKGIANIDSSYTATHVDVRTSGVWYGDEVVTTATSVTSDFYSYYGLTKSDVYPTAKKDTIEVAVTVNGKNYSGILTEK